MVRARVGKNTSAGMPGLSARLLSFATSSFGSRTRPVQKLMPDLWSRVRSAVRNLPPPRAAWGAWTPEGRTGGVSPPVGAQRLDEQHANALLESSPLRRHPTRRAFRAPPSPHYARRREN